MTRTLTILIATLTLLLVLTTSAFATPVNVKNCLPIPGDHPWACMTTSNQIVHCKSYDAVKKVAYDCVTV